jgi:hypothetical protein
MNHPTRSHPILHALLLGSALLALPVSQPRATAASAPEKAFHPGDLWLDTSGNFINAHGGGLLYHGGVYYWYGEYKTGKTFLPDVNKGWGGTRVVSRGFSCYSSKNLYDWKFEGIALPAEANDRKSDLHQDKVMERPKVIYNAKTKKFVMWFHQDETNYSGARSGVAVSDRPTGPFKYLGSFRPDAGVWPVNATDADKHPSKENVLSRDFEKGQMARDMTLFVDDDGTAYQFYASEGNPTMHVSQLSDDYLKPAGKYARIFIGRSCEAPAVFKRNGKYYLLASGCSGWKPNPARSAVADHIFGPWKELGNPCRGEDAANTFQGQSTYVLPIAGAPGTFIAMFDRWKQWDLADSRYVWLPVEFENDAPTIPWKASWSLPGK